MGFDEVFDRLIGHEGGYVNHKDDPGGETNWGISKRSYPAIDIAKLTRDEAKEIYRRDFWQRARMTEYDPAIAYQVFDIGVNSGIETAVRLLQRAVGVADDGHLGPVTLAKIAAMSRTDVISRLIAERLDFWTKLSTWPTFGKGWARRAANTLREAAADT
jgi:lysozyme family protein